MSFHVTKKFVCTENYPIVDTPKGKLHGYQDNDIFCFTLRSEYSKIF